MMLLLTLACAPPTAQLCPAYSGFSVEGRIWEYQSFADEDRWEVVLSELSAEAVSLVGPGWTESYLCDEEGLWTLGRHEEEGDFSADWAYDPASLRLPAAIAEGDAWTVEAAWIYSDSDGVSRTQSTSTQVDVVATSESHVTAGSFEVLELHVLNEDAAADREYREADIGLVLTDGAQLVAVRDPE